MIFGFKSKLLLILFAGTVLLLSIISFLSPLITSKKQAPSPSVSPPVVTPWPTANPSQTPLVPTDIQKQQNADANFGNELQKIQKSYPWYNNLPLMDTNYFVYFDLGKKQLVAKIYSKSNNLSVQQVEEIKTSIISKLIELRIPTDQYPVVWQTGI